MIRFESDIRFRSPIQVADTVVWHPQEAPTVEPDREVIFCVRGVISPLLANVYLHYAQITNEAQAQYTLTIGGSSAVAGATPRGADPMAVGLGIRYTF